MLVLLHDLNGNGAMPIIPKHWYVMNKNTKNYRKIHDLMNNLELHYQRIIFNNYKFIKLIDESPERVFDENLMHVTELFALRLKIFKNAKLAHPEDVDDQIFTHSVLAKVY